METGQEFYRRSRLRAFDREDVLAGRVIRINPALITITDGLVASTPAAELQCRVRERVAELIDHRVRTFHVDINFTDYSGFSGAGPDVNDSVFTPDFLAGLGEFVRSRGGYLNLHLLTDRPLDHLPDYRDAGFGAICFQLDVIRTASELAEVVAAIDAMGATASPVIETVGSEKIAPRSPEQVLELCRPSLAAIGMWTIQAAGTASRSDQAAGRFSGSRAGEYLVRLKEGFGGTIQLQGGVTTATIGDVVTLGAEFLVCGTEIFRNKAGLRPPEVIDGMLRTAADALCPGK